MAEMQIIVFFMVNKKKFYFKQTKICLSTVIFVMKLPDKTTWSKGRLATGHWSLGVETFGPLFQQFLKCSSYLVLN